MNRINNFNKLALNRVEITWIAISLVTVLITNFVFSVNSLSGIDSLVLSISNISIVMCILTYSKRVHVSAGFLLISEALYSITRIDGSKIINVETVLAFIAFLSCLYIVIRNIRKSNTVLNIGELFKAKVEPFKTSVMTKFILATLMITTVFTLAGQEIAKNPQVTLLAIIYIMLPSFIIILSIVPVREVIYIRYMYYILWIMIIIRGNEVNITSLIGAVVPTVYFGSVVVAEYTRYKTYRNKRV